MLTGATVVGPDFVLKAGTVLVENGQITTVTPEPPASLLLSEDDVTVVTAAEGDFLTPGLIDLQMNGAFGCDFNQDSLESIHGVLDTLPQHGITGILATVITHGTIEMVTAINTLEQALYLQKPEQSKLLGLHLEGPFLNPAFRGTHPATAIQPPNLETLQTLLSPNTRLMTLAPELDPNGLVIGALYGQGIRVSAGHTGATSQEAAEAVDQGVRGITHLFNSMKPFHHRDPGILATALNDNRLWTMLIADGHHVAPEALRLVFNMKPLERVILVSDLMNLAGLPEGQSLPFAGQLVKKSKGRAVNQEGNLAGSIALLHEGLQNLVRWKIVSFEDAIQTATRTPAEFLGLSDRGRIAPGCVADLVLWDSKTLTPKATWIAGEMVYSSQNHRATSKTPA